MSQLAVRASTQHGQLRQVGAWIGATAVYGAAQGLSAWAAQHARGRGTRPQYQQFDRPAFAPPGAVFPVVWSGLNLTTATSAWLVWRAAQTVPQAAQTIRRRRGPARRLPRPSRRRRGPARRQRERRQERR